MASLGRDAILKSSDLKRECVSIPQWGGQVWVRELSATEYDSWEQQIFDLRAGKMRANISNLRASLCAVAIVDEQGKSIFSTEETKTLGMKSAKAIRLIFDTCCRLSGIGADLDGQEVAEGNP